MTSSIRSLSASPGCALLAALLMASTAAAQERPSYAGRWTLAADSTAAAAAGPARPARGDLGSGWGSPMTITQDANRLVVEYAFFTRGDMQPPLRFVYALDGSETTNTLMMGHGFQTQKSRTAWESDRLVIRTTHSFNDPVSGRAIPVEVKQVLSLESGARLLVETTRSGVLGGPENITKSVYVRN